MTRLAFQCGSSSSNGPCPFDNQDAEECGEAGGCERRGAALSPRPDLRKSPCSAARGRRGALRLGALLVMLGATAAGAVADLPRVSRFFPTWFFFFFLFFKLFIYLFIYFWLRWVFVSVRGLSLVVASGGHS